MSESKKYFYIKLKEGYFERDNIKVLESKENGYIYSLIILKMYLKSCKGNGKLMMTDSIPYDSEKVDILARVIGHDIAHVKEAIRAGIELDLITVTDSKEIWMNEMQNMIGKSTSEADRVRKYRKNLECTKTVQNPYICTPELEIEKEKELEIENPTPSKNPQSKQYLEFVYLLDTEYNTLIMLYGEKTILKYIERLNNYIGSTGKIYKRHYHTIKGWLEKDNVRTLSEEKELDKELEDIKF